MLLLGCDPTFGVQGTISVDEGVSTDEFVRLRIESGPASEGPFRPLHGETYVVQDGHVMNLHGGYEGGFPFEYSLMLGHYTGEPQWVVRAWLSTGELDEPAPTDAMAQADYELPDCTFYVKPSYCGWPDVDLKLSLR